MIGKLKPLLRRRASGYFAVGLLLGLIAVVVVTPLAVPIERVRGGLARIFASYAGHDVRIDAVARVRLFPQMLVEFRNFAVKDGTGSATLMTAERVDVSVDVVQYLLGRSPVASVEMRKPSLTVSGTSLIGDLLTRKRLARLRPVNLILHDADLTVWTATGPVRLEALDLTLAWPRQTAPLRFAGSFSFLGEPVTISGQGMGPAALASGDSGNLAVSMTSALARLAFAGRAVLLDQIQLDGSLSASMSRPTGLVGLLSGQAAAGRPPQDLDISRIDADGRLRLVGQQAILSEAAFRLGNAKAEGFLSAQWDSARPQVRGTVDFGSVGLAMNDLPVLGAEMGALLSQPQALRAADLDLRVSLARLETGLIRFGQVAATLIVKDGRLDGQFVEADPRDDGSLSARVTAGPGPDGTRVEGSATLTRIAMAPILSKLGWSAMSGGRVSGDLALRTVLGPGRGAIEQLRGRFDGHILDARFARTIKPATMPGPIAPEDAVPEIDRYDRIDVGADLAGAAVWVDRCMATASDRTVTLTGSVDFGQGVVQLTGNELMTDRKSTQKLTLSGPLASPDLVRSP